MDRESIKELLREVLGPNTEMADQPKWVSIHCPLAPYKHAKGTDKSMSAGVSVKDGDISIFHCYGCGSKGPIPYLLTELEKYTGDNWGALKRSITDDEFLGASLPEWGNRAAEDRKVRTLSEDYLEIYEPAIGHWYLQERGISDATANKLQLMVDPEDSAGDERILFPVMTPSGDLAGFTGRATSNDVQMRVRDYHGLQKSLCLLGAQFIQRSKYLIVVEGLFDYARLHNFGLPGVATMFAGLTDAQADILKQAGKPVVLMYDNDVAGENAKHVAYEKLGKWVPLSAATYPKMSNRRTMRRVKLKDPGAARHQHLLWMLENAKVL